MRHGPRRFGRALHLTPKKRLMERLYDALWAGGWPSAAARPLGLQGRLRLVTHELPVAGYPPDAPPLRLAFASDFHAGPGTHPETIERSLALLAEQRPDLLLLGGDFYSFHVRHVEPLVGLLAGFPAPLGKFAVLGNHDLIGDDEHLVGRLADAGVRTLVNESARVETRDADVWICGLDNPEQGTPDGEAAFARSGAINLLLMHSPDGLAAVGDRRWAAAFCGHVHGGQFWWRGRSVIAQKGPLSHRYLRGGLFELGAPGERLLLVSRGIGQGSLPLRRGADPEVHLCVLRGHGPTAKA
jgi:hypothetical protein